MSEREGEGLNWVGVIMIGLFLAMVVLAVLWLIAGVGSNYYN